MRIPSPIARRKARIEIIPLIDIIFFLLATFIMVSLSMVHNQGLPVHLPTASSSVPQSQQDSVTLTVSETGEIFLNKDPVTLQELKNRLGDIKADQPDLKVFIQGDENASLGSAVLVLDEVRKLGISKIAIQTKTGVEK
jgi:biopolymer transport protein ExbD